MRQLKGAGPQQLIVSSWPLQSLFLTCHRAANKKTGRSRVNNGLVHVEHNNADTDEQRCVRLVIKGCIRPILPSSVCFRDWRREYNKIEAG